MYPPTFYLLSDLHMKYLRSACSGVRSRASWRGNKDKTRRQFLGCSVVSIGLHRTLQGISLENLNTTVLYTIHRPMFVINLRRVSVQLEPTLLSRRSLECCGTPASLLAGLLGTIRGRIAGVAIPAIVVRRTIGILIVIATVAAPVVIRYTCESSRGRSPRTCYYSGSRGLHSR